MQNIKELLKNTKISWMLFYIFIFFFLLYNSFSYLDPDIGWHLRVGSDIFATKSVPNFEYYNFSLEGQTWVDHEWLINLLSYLIYSKFSYITLSIFFTLLIVLTLIIQSIVLKKYFLSNKNNSFLIMFWQFFAVLAMSPHLGVRMQEITLFFLLLELIIIYYYNIKKNYKFLFILLPLFYLWACIHAGFLIGLFVLFLFILVKTFEHAVKNLKIFNFITLQNQLSLKKISIFCLFSVLAFFTTLLTPYKLNLYGFLKSYTNTYYLMHIAEWLPAWSWPIMYFQTVYLAISTTILFFFFYLSLKNRNKNVDIDLWQLALFLTFFLLAFKSRRHFPLFFIVSFPFFLQFIQKYLFLPDKFSFFLQKNRFINTYTSFGLIILSFSLFLVTNFTKNPFTSADYCQSYPCEAINFLKNNEVLIGKRIFNNYTWGGFMTWVYPEKKLFIDGRLPQFEYNGQTMLEEYNDFFDREKTEEKISSHKIDTVLLAKQQKIKLNWIEKNIFGINEQKISSQANYLRNFLNSSQNWELVYNDDISEIYSKKPLYDN